MRSLLILLLTALSLNLSTGHPLTLAYLPAAGNEMFLAGQVQAGRWLPSAKVPAPRAQPWTLYRLGTRPRTIGGGAMTTDGVGSRIVKVSSRPPGDALAVAGGSPRVPRPARSLPLTDPPSVACMAAFLHSRGLGVPQPRLVQNLRADLNGSGRDDWLLVAASRDDLRNAEHPVMPSDYMIIGLAGVGKPLQPLAVETGKDKNGIENTFRVIALLDLLGNNHMEIAVSQMSYEDLGVIIFDGASGKSLLSEMWGP
jgi:hypothetical protein